MSLPAIKPLRSAKKWLLGIAAVLLGLGLLTAEIVYTRPVRQAVRAYTDLIEAANRSNLPEARKHCSARYLRAHELKLADEGGIIGLPRNINKNFQTWRDRDDIWLCPTNRIGPVYRFVIEDGDWKFDGAVGVLRSGGLEVMLNEQAR